MRQVFLPALATLALIGACSSGPSEDSPTGSGAAGGGGSPNDAGGGGAHSDAGGGGAHGDAGPGDALGSRSFTCRASKSPMFKSREVMNMRISADFTKLNSAPTPEESGSEATIELQDAAGAAPITANIVARGSSRFNCGFRPFALKFSEKQKDNPFERLGKSVKFVTHCGDREGLSATLKADSIEAYEQRVLMEQAIYQVLDPLEVPLLKTRLVQLTYHDTQTEKEETHLTFVREPEDKMAERCGMVEMDRVDPAAAGPFTENKHSKLLMHFLNGLVVQYDWSFGKNTVAMVDLARKEAFYGPYDFDLVGVFRPDYVANGGRTIEQNRDAFADWLRRNQSATLFSEIDVMLERSGLMQSAVEQSSMTDENRALFSKWLSLYVKLLQDFRGCEGHADDASQPMCYVEDDYSGLPASATPIELGERTTRLEPPGDVDMFAVELQADTLYTVGGRANLELLDDSGNSVAKTSDEAFSVRPTRAGTYHLRASLGDTLVSSPLLPLPYEIDRNVYIYADDYGSSVETAMPLSAGQTVPGKWELTVGEDQDWLLVTANASTSLHVRLEEPGWGFAQVVRRGAPEGEFPAEGDLAEGDNDLSPLFGEPGDYIVKLVQISGFDGSTSYTVQLQ